MNAKVYIAILSLLFFVQLKAQQDVGVTTMIAPLSGCNVGTSSTPINVIVRNFSLSTAFPNTITVRYSINSGPVTSELIGAILGPNASFNFTFFQTANFNACGSYQIKVWTQKTGDPNPLNDTLNYLFVKDCNPIPGTITGPLLLCNNQNSDSLVVSGGTYSYGYQWFQQVVPGPFNPTGNTTNKFYLNNLGDSTSYYVRYNGGLCPSVNSSIFGIGISPNIVTGTVSPDLTLCIDNVVGNVSNSGFTALIEDWEQSNNGGLTWNPLGITTSSVNINYLTNSALFRSKVKSGACGFKYSDTVSITIEPLIVPGTISGTNTVCYGTNVVNLSLSGQANHYGYEWYISTDNITFIPTGNTSSTFNDANLTQTTYYKVVLQGNICSDAETSVAVVTVNPLVNVGVTSPDLSFCSLSVSGAVSLSGYVTTILDWEQSNDGGTTWFSTGYTTPSLNISYLTATADFRAHVESPGCGIGYSDTINVFIEQAILPGAINGNHIVCNGSNSDTLAILAYANHTSLEWYSATLASPTYVPTGITNDTLITSNISVTTYYYVILDGNLCPPDTTSEVYVQVDPSFALGTTSPDLFLCSNNLNGFVSVPGYSSTLVDWEQSNNGGITWFSTLDNSDFHDISGLTSSADFRAFISSGSCGSGYSDTISVTIEDAIIPGVISSSNAVCSFTNSDTLVLTGNSNQISFEWYSSPDNTTYTPTGITNDTLITSNLTQSIYYKVIHQGNYCPTAETNVIYIQVDSSLSLGITSPDLLLCSDNIFGSVYLSNYTSNLVDWEQSNDGGITWFSTGNNASVHGISYLTASASFRALLSAGACGSGYSNTINVVIQNAIVPGSIVVPNNVVCNGANADTLILTGNANQISFEWFSSLDNTSFSPTGITTNTFVLANITQSTYYKVVLLGDYCANSETNSVFIQVGPPLNLGIISPDLQLCSVNITGNVYLSNYATTLLDWEQSNDGGLTWFSTTNNSPVFSISYLTASASFRAIVNSGACGSGISDTVNVVIQDAIIPGSITSGGVSVCAGANSDTLVLTGNANAVSFQWYSSLDNVTFTPTGITNDTLITPNITQSTYYKVILQGDFCPNVQTNTEFVQVSPGLNLGIISPDLLLCSDNITGYVYITNYSATLVNWEQSNDGGATWISTGSNAAYHDISYLTASASFRAIIANGSCGTGISDTIDVIIQNAIVTGTISANTTSVCTGSNSDTLALTGYSNVSSMLWYSSLDNTTYTSTGVTNDTLVTSNITQSTYYKVYLQGSSSCPSAQTGLILIQVDSNLNLGTISPDLYLCSNNIFGGVYLSNYSTTILDWEQSDNGGATWFSTGNNSSVHGISYLTAPASFRVIVASGACGTGISDTINVVLENTIIPGTISGNGAICSGVNVDTLVLSGYANQTSFEWYSSTNNSTFTPTGITNDTLIITNLSQTIYYKVVLQGNVCPGAETSTYTVQVDQPLNVGTISPDLFLCSNNIAGNLTLSNYATTILDWEQSDDGGLTWNSLSTTTPILDISFLTASALFRAVVGSGSCGTGVSPIGAVTIENEIIPGVISGGTILCYGNNTDTLVLTGNANEISYQWYVTTTNTSYLPTGVSNDTFVVNNLTHETYIKVVLYGNYCPDVQTVVYVLQIDTPVVTGIPSPDLNLCVDNITGSITLYNYSTTILDWEQSNDGGVNFFSLLNNSPVLDISFLTASAKFRAVVASGVCGTGISDTISVNIDALGTPATIGFDFITCVGSPDLDSMKVLSHTGSILNWQSSVDNGSTWSTSMISDTINHVSFLPGNTIYRVTTNHGACPNVTSNIVSAIANPIPSVYAGVDTSIYQYNSVQLSGSGGAYGVWSPATFLTDPTLPSPKCTPTQTTIYAYTVIDINGCTNTDFVQITVLPDSTGFPFIIYNIVTPNGDGKNDYFTIKGLYTLDNYLIKIFNANGNLLFSSKDYKNDWGATYKGEIVPDGTYLYAIEVDHVTMYRGFLTVMRGND